MIELGKIQELEVKRHTSVGAFLNTEDSGRDDEDVLLPKSDLPENIKVGEKVEVFVYRDSQDRVISTTKKPLVTLGEIAPLEVIDITKIGAFLDWGLERDLFLPFSEQSVKLEKGRKYLIGLYIDKSNRLCGTMKIRNFLRNDSTYKPNDWVQATIYNLNDDLGAFVAVDNKYEGLIPRKELLGVYVEGEELKVRVTNVNEYGRNKDFYGKILTDEEFKNNLMTMMMVEVYNELRKSS